MGWTEQLLYRKTNQAENMIVLIPEGIKKVWNEWNIRGFILFSLLLQIFLLCTASLRKKTANKLVIFTIWSAYLLADWAASFAIGLVFNSEERYTSGPGTVDDTGLLMVLWTPFLLLLAGGQDRITSFAIEDNELWLRHLIWLILQVFTTGFVFIQSLHPNRLWMPTLLLLIAGIIKYAERTAALYLASSNSFGISLLTKPDPGPNYEKLMSTYSNFHVTGLPTRFDCLEGEESQVGKFNYTVNEGESHSRSLVEYAYHFTNMYKGLIVNLMFSSRVHKESRDFFSKRTAEDTLSILEITLNFFYDIIHTKIVAATSKIGIISRCISIGLVFSALLLFYKEEKHGFQRFDVKVTYTLFFGISGLDMVTLLLWLFSDWAIVSLKKYEKNSLSKIFDKFLDFKKPRWKQTADTTKNCFYSHVLKGESQGGSHDHSQTRTTPIIFKRWSETLSQYNFVDYCWEERSKGIYLVEIRSMITRMLKYFHIKDFIDQAKYVLPKPLTKSLWEFIFNELLEKSKDADNPEDVKRISSARGEWVLRQCVFIDNLDCIIGSILPYVTDVAYDESLLLWHIATELCYNSTAHSDNCDDRELSKYLSDYMLYLLYQQPSLMSEVSGIAKQRFRDTWAEVERFFSQRTLNKKEDLCQEILEVETLVKPVYVKGNRSKSVLFDASMLAKEIKKLDSVKWKVTSKVWVELLSYAASRSRGNAHVQQLSRGGELLTFVWLLMAQCGLREAWVETRFSAKLIVDY